MMPTASSISSVVCVAIRLVRSRHSCGAAAGGSEVLAISIPSRYLHSPACVADEKDIENTLELLRLLPEALAL